MPIEDHEIDERHRPERGALVRGSSRQRREPLPARRSLSGDVQPDVFVGEQCPRQILGPFQVTAEPECIFCEPAEQHQPPPGDSTMNVSLLPPPCEELTTREPLRSATRVSPPRVT